MYSTNRAYYEPDKKTSLKFSFSKLGTILAFSHGTLYLMSAETGPKQGSCQESLTFYIVREQVF